MSGSLFQTGLRRVSEWGVGPMARAGCLLYTVHTSGSKTGVTTRCPGKNSLLRGRENGKSVFVTLLYSTKRTEKPVHFKFKILKMDSHKYACGKKGYSVQSLRSTGP